MARGQQQSTLKNPPEKDKNRGLSPVVQGGSDIMTSAMIGDKVTPGRKPNFEISSQHPAFSRRPVAMPEEIAKDTRVKAVVFVGELE
jgi:hypothetical protein